MLKKLLTIFLISGLLLGALFLSCAEDDPTLTRFVQNLVLEIIAGPKEGSTLLNNEFFTFEWRGQGGGGGITYEIQLTGVDASAITTTEVSKSYSGQPEGTYTFTVTARAGSESSSDSRTFSVGANLGPPTVTITGARGSASTGGSGATPVYAPGATSFVQWSGQDIDRFGEVEGYRWDSDGTQGFNEFSMANTAGFAVPGTPGTYTFTLEAIDNGGETSSTTFDYEVKNATIVVVDDKPQGDPLDELDEDQFYADLLEGFAFATWDVAAQGIPTIGDLSGFEVAILYSTGGSAWWTAIGTDFPESAVQLSDFVDGGGKLWVMGQGIMEDISGDHTNPPAATEFEAVYLHLAPATGDSTTDAGRTWSRAGDFDGDLQFTFADDVLGDPVNFPRIAIQAQSGDVEEIVAGTGAEIIYEGKGGLGDPIGDVALRFPSGGTSTDIVFMTFPLFENVAAKASLVGSRALTQEIMREMGQ